MSQSVGAIHYDLGLNTRGFDTGVAAVGSRLNSLGSSLQRTGGQISQLGSSITGVALPAVVALGGVFAASSAMAFNQVRSVENASFALKAYEKDAGKVNNVLSTLIDFAQSDMGVLFQREDLFAAASTLKLYGQETDTLTDKVKILARGVSLGKTTFQELSAIIGRAAAKGRLDAVDFDMLIERGIGIDRSFRGAAVTSEQLFKELERALPASLLEGRANTIDGLAVRLQSAFRNLGAEILGVDKATSTFTAGGLGDRLVKLMTDLADMMKRPEVKEGFAKIGASIAEFASKALPLMIDLLAFIGENIEPISKFAVGLLGVGVALQLIGAAVSGAGAIMTIFGSPVLLAVVGVMAALIALGVVIWDNREAFLKLWGDASKAFEMAAPVIQFVWGILKGLFDFMVAQFQPMLGWLKDNWDKIRPVLMLVGAAILWLSAGPFIAVIAGIAAIMAVIGAAMWVINRLVGAWNWLGAASQNAGRVVSSAIGGAMNFVTSVIGGAIGWITGAAGRFYSAGRGLIDAFANGVRAAAGAVIGAVQGVLSKVRQMLPFSDAKVGPLSDLTLSGQRMVETLAKGVMQARSDLEGAMAVTLTQSQNPIANQQPMGGATSIYGNVNINSQQDADYFFNRLNRTQDFTSMGVAS